MPAALEPTDKFLSPGTGFRILYRLVADNVYAPVTYTLGGAASAGASAVTMADGASATLGTTTDAPATGDNVTATAIALLKRALQLQTLYAGTKHDSAPALTSGSGNIGWLSLIARRLTPGATNGAASLPVVLASDDAMIGTAITAAGGLGAGGLGLTGWVSTVAARLPATLGQKAMAASLAVTLASDDAQIGTKVAAIAGLGSGGTGIVGWLSQVWQAQSNLSAQLPATLGIKTSALSLSTAPASDANVAREFYGAVTNMTVATLAAGANFNAFGAQACTSLDLLNTSTVDIEYRRGGAGVAIPIPAGASRLLQGITNASQIGVRRVDQIGNPVNVFAEAFAV